jgi:hypothetical protein
MSGSASLYVIPRCAIACLELTNGELVMPGLVPGIHVFAQECKKDVDDRDKPGQDGRVAYQNSRFASPGMTKIAIH